MTQLLSDYANHIGIIGVILTLIAYYYLNIGKLASESLMYSMLNFIGSWLILFSLMYHWNLSSVLIEIAWISISLIGIYRYYAAKKRKLAQ